MAYNGHTLTLSSPLAEAISLRGAHWNALYDRAIATINVIKQNRFAALALICAKYIQFLPHMHGMSRADNLIHWITHFLDRTQGVASNRDAILYLSRSRWNLDIAVERWCDEAKFKKMGTELYSDSEELEFEELNEEAEIAPLNRSVDRKPAVKGQPTQSKFLIVIQQPRGRPDKRNQYKNAERREAFDWNNSNDIRTLNRWRSQILRRNLGSARAARVSFHPIEVDWLYQIHLDFQQDALAKNEPVIWNRIRWDTVTTDFNKHFYGKSLPGATGLRPSRTKASLMTERYRVPRITNLAGLTLKGTGKKRGVDVEDVEDLENDNMDLEADNDDMDLEADNHDSIHSHDTPETHSHDPQLSSQSHEKVDRAASSPSSLSTLENSL